jgi:hypothetical protein
MISNNDNGNRIVYTNDNNNKKRRKEKKRKMEEASNSLNTNNTNSLNTNSTTTAIDISSNAGTESNKTGINKKKRYNNKKNKHKVHAPTSDYEKSDSTITATAISSITDQVRAEIVETNDITINDNDNNRIVKKAKYSQIEVPQIIDNYYGSSLILVEFLKCAIDITMVIILAAFEMIFVVLSNIPSRIAIDLKSFVSKYLNLYWHSTTHSVEKLLYGTKVLKKMVNGHHH